MTVSLILPTREYEQSYRGYIEELGREERYPFQLDFEHDDFASLLQRLEEFSNGTNIPNGSEPTSTYWLIEERELVGVSSLRHRMNARIRECGGHIGLGIRPSRRMRGLGTRLMALTLQKAHEAGIGEVHVHCHKDNEASARMILRNGGVLRSEVATGDPQTIVQRYTVQTTDDSAST